METIGIFRGKQEENNKFLLETLYNEGPSSAWELTLYQKIGTKIIRTSKKAHARNRMSLHAVYNKRLRILAKKGYVRKVGKTWVLQFKGIIAVLLIQPEPKPWSDRYTNIIGEYAKLLEEKSKPFMSQSVKIGDKEIHPLEFVKRAPIVLRRFEDWIGFANLIKNFMERGIINFDLIKNKTLLALIVTEASHDIVNNGLGE